MYKSVALLKQVEKGFSFSDNDVSGIIRIEGEDIFSLNLTTLNFKYIESGNYYLFVYGKKVHPFLLENKPSLFSATITDFNPENGLCAGVFYVENGLPVLLAFGKDQNFKLSLNDFKSSVSAYFLEKRRNMQELELKKQKVDFGFDKNADTPSLKENGGDFSVPVANPKESENLRTFYDDEAVATYNYFENGENESEKAGNETFYESGSAKVHENETFYENESEKVHENETFYESEAVYENKKTESVEKNCSCDTPFGDKILKSTAKRYSADNPYVDTCREDLETLFGKFPKEESLVKLFNGSDFVKIHYSGDKYYVVGLIKENGKDKYICYGIPCEYTETPPKELDGYCVFIPLSVFDMKGDGYFLMFQDAVTGECVKKIEYVI